MEKQKKSKGLTMFAIAAIALLAMGFALGVSDNAKLLTASAISGMSISEIQYKLEQLSDSISENEKLLNDLENSDLNEQELQRQIDVLKTQNQELRQSTIDLINILHEELLKEQIEEIVSTSSSHSSHSSNDEDDAPKCTISDCHNGRLVHDDDGSCHCEKIANNLKTA